MEKNSLYKKSDDARINERHIHILNLAIEDANKRIADYLATGGKESDHYINVQKDKIGHYARNIKEIS